MATSHGKLYALDSASGDVVWSRVFGLGWAGEVGEGGKGPVGAVVVPLKVFTIRGVGDVSGSGSGRDEEGRRREGDVVEVVVVAQRKAHNVSPRFFLPFVFVLC